MKLYVIRWLHDYYYHEHGFRGGAPIRPRACRLVKAFVDPTEAERFRVQLEKGLRPPLPEANPFVGFREDNYYMADCYPFRGLQDLTSLPEQVFDDWLQDLGLTPPPTDPTVQGHRWKRDWYKWWETNAPAMTDIQRAKIWQALDKLDFYEIVETDLED